MANPIRMVFFDIGGVLVRADLERYVTLGVALFGSTPEAIKREVMARVPALEKGALDSATFWKQIGESLWRRGEGRPAPPEQCRWLWRDLMSATAEVDHQVVGILQILKEQGVRLGAITNTIEDHVPVMTEMGIYRIFDPCVISCRHGHRKPEKEIYRKAAQLAGLKPRDCAFVDDVAENVEGARKAGMVGILYTSPEELFRDLVKLRIIA